MKGDLESSTQRRLRNVPFCLSVVGSVSRRGVKEGLSLFLLSNRWRCFLYVLVFCLAAASWALEAAAQMTLTERYEVKSLNSLSFWWYVEEKWNPGGIQFPIAIYHTFWDTWLHVLVIFFFFFSKSNVPSHFPSLYLWGLCESNNILLSLPPQNEPGFQAWLQKSVFPLHFVTLSGRCPFFIWHSAQPSAAHGINL